ncbi:MAG: YecA family protein, partial [Methylococcales bacterium]|nr:YecA family protein [Methylococcales bacterium]
MAEDYQYPIHSPLGQSLTQDGKTVHVEIYEDGDSGWLLEVVDEYGNSTVWDDPFQSDKAALDEAIRTIDEEGIDSLIGTPSASPASSELSNTLQMMAPLSNEEMDELDRFLMSDATSNETMPLDCLDGFLTAIVSGPVMLKPSEWLPHVWGPTEQDAPTFDTLEQAERVTVLIMRQLNGIIWSLQQDADAFEPVFDTVVYPDDSHEYINGEMWAHGYMNGIELQRQNWKVFFDEPNSAEVLRPIYLLGADDVTMEEEALTETPAQREKLSEQIPASVAWIYKFWQPYRQAMAERSIATTFQ